MSTDPVLSAKDAGLNHVSDSAPGIRRSGVKRKFRYRDPSGRIVANSDVLKRIRSLVIPPAWTDVWISTDPQGHVQAIGRDSRGRKQYRYHPRWRETRDSTKFHRLAQFGQTLPKIRARVSRDLSAGTLSQAKVLATIVRLLDTTSMRVGNEEYTRQNRSYGLTTLRDRHVEVRGKQVRFFFRGKSGVQHRISVEDRGLARIVRTLRDLPGYELFQYIDDDGSIQSIDSTNVNNYIRDVAGKEFTAKDFRTWNGTVIAATALCKMPPCSSQAKLKKDIVIAVESVAEHLGNTVAVCRNCYIHPALFDAYMAQTLTRELKNGRRITGLSARECAVLHFLRKQSPPKRAQRSLG